MELRDLKAFVTLGEVLHFGQAAVRQHVTQSALSKQIQAAGRGAVRRAVRAQRQYHSPHRTGQGAV